MMVLVRNSVAFCFLFSVFFLFSHFGCERRTLMDAGHRRASQKISLEGYGVFLSRSIRFDYCGVRELDSAEYKPWQKLAPGRLYIEYIRNGFISEMVAFQNLAERCECAISRGDRKVFQNTQSEIAGMLREEKKMCLSADFKFSPFDFFSNIAKIEYVLARSITDGNNARKDFLKGEDINALLPDDLFSADFSNCHWVCVDDLYLVKRKKFRDMLVAGLAISREFGSFLGGDNPSPRADNDASSKLKARIDGVGMKYSASNHVWQLFWTNDRHGHDVMPFNAYIPVIDGIGGLQSNDMWLSTRNPVWMSTKDCLWLSSDYARKRREIYEQGCFNDEFNQITYEMKDGKIQKR